jgi:hypothetical protein
MVDGYAEAGQPREAPSQQRRPASAVFDGNVIATHGHLDPHLSHAPQGS